MPSFATETRTYVGESGTTAFDGFAMAAAPTSPNATGHLAALNGSAGAW